MKWVFIISTLLLMEGCRQNEKTIQQNKETVIKDFQRWDSLEIKTRYQTLTVFKYEDSANYQNISYDKEMYDIPPKYNNKKVKNLKLYFTKAEKDSLAKYIFTSVTKPKFTNILATDYVGNVSFTFSRINMNLVCEYQSVSDWTEVSDETKMIYGLIGKKAQFSVQ